LLRPAPEAALEMVAISNRVNRVGEYGPEVHEPLAESRPAAGD
jgi:putative SOS response-associated peptidase YedK